MNMLKFVHFYNWEAWIYSDPKHALDPHHVYMHKYALKPQ